ncbi:hypothetical protein GCM10010507_38210 [Streptomyces cinnamoneus]|uniref:Uncharacterized protein n=1 Tax=Streptomyces cinnamoneus TaxID=53446 RepID=A0A918TPQ4_STRCJ|nr:hypothetical protein GCM10010507_38210 [Streptomyces cinnamoneus]
MKVAADADLVGGDRGVFSVGLALAAVALRGPVDSPAGDVVDRLAVVEQDRDGQRGSAVGQIDTPGRLVAQGEYVGEKPEQFRLVVGDAA